MNKIHKYKSVRGSWNTVLSNCHLCEASFIILQRNKHFECNFGFNKIKFVKMISTKYYKLPMIAILDSTIWINGPSLSRHSAIYRRAGGQAGRNYRTAPYCIVHCYNVLYSAALLPNSGGSPEQMSITYKQTGIKKSGLKIQRIKYCFQAGLDNFFTVHKGQGKSAPAPPPGPLHNF